MPNSFQYTKTAMSTRTRLGVAAGVEDVGVADGEVVVDEEGEVMGVVAVVMVAAVVMAAVVATVVAAVVVAMAGTGTGIATVGTVIEGHQGNVTVTTVVGVVDTEGEVATVVVVAVTEAEDTAGTEVQFGPGIGT